MSNAPATQDPRDAGSPDWPPGADEATFIANLQALADVDRPLAERLCWSVAGGHLLREEGRLRYRSGQSTFDVELSSEAAGELVDAALEGVATGRDERQVLILGVGAGELIAEALGRGAAVLAWDHDPWMFRMVLGSRDLTAPLRRGQLRLALGTDLLTPALREALGTDPGGARIDHPLFARVYAPQIRLALAGLGERRALLCEGGLFVDSMRRALEAEGWSVWTVDVERLSVEELQHTAKALGAKLLVSINDRAGLAEFAREVGAQLLVWEIDPSTSVPIPPAGPEDHAHLFSFRRENVRRYRQAGRAQAEYLPLAADTELRSPLTLSADERARYRAPISFVGASMVDSAARNMARFEQLFAAWHSTLSAERRANDGTSGDSGSLDPARIARDLLQAQRADFTHWRLTELLDEAAPGFADWCHTHLAGEDPAMLLGESSASERRLTWAAELGAFGLQLWGDPGWNNATPSGCTYRGLATHHHDLTRIYNASQINLDIGRLYQTDIVTMRVFDVLACGGFALVEHSADVEELFEVGEELETYRDPAELSEKVAWYLEHPARCQEIGARGREAVLTRHSFASRVQHMLSACDLLQPA